ncbi:Ubiquitin-protein ligase [Pyrenophora tritici-repentis]|nr:Ubiquitin-protein ligase [Pyrenophora tritici-repentis]PWO26504.1 Inp1 domain containing protein [Pyrenophora tritici-repentis]PZC89378.1 Ubiquitin-protein ligase [Pyrenophora tritici-repentis]
MTTRGQFNTKNPTIKRILKEASELSTSPSSDYHAEPLETNLFEWHFTIRGPPEPSPYAGGIYHGRIVLPSSYPLRPPSFRFLTPTGRFEVNREICLSISGHHEETWQPAWGVRTALVAIRSFMDTDAKGQLGGIECSKNARERMAKESDELGKGENADDKVDKGKGRATESPVQVKPAASPSGSEAAAATPIVDTARPVPVAPMVRPTRTVPAPAPHQVAHRSPDLAWIDTCIYGVVAALLFMVLRRFV